jgi:Carboxypeptidase regulatory-like domain
MGKLTQRMLSKVLKIEKNLPKLLLFTLIILCHILTDIHSVLAEPTKNPTNPNFAQQVAPVPVDQFNPRLLPVGLLVNNKTKLESFSVLGQEDGTKAIRFEDWLLPFDELAPALGFKIKEIDDQLELSTSSQRFRLPANKIIANKTLGRAILVRDLAAIPGFIVKFDLYKYAVDITLPGGVRDNFGVDAPPVILDGLERVKPASDFGMSIIQERLNTSGTVGSTTKSEIQGELRAAGNILDAGWYLRFNQPSIGDTKNWNLSDGVILRQRTTDDLIIGSQSPFWRFRSTATGTYWGATTVYRQGFEPPVRFSGGDYVLAERLQARRTGRTISGTAAPGTLVQLVKNDRNVLVKEILVDSSGVYRFDNIVVSGNLDSDLIGRDYKILLYPRGQLTANPIVQDIAFTSFSGQIPVGASAIVVSAGGNRISSGNFGSFDAAQGGVLYRRGISDSLTIGAGVAIDRSLKGIGELFWQPSNPLEISMSAAVGGQQSDYIGRLNYRPSNNFSLTGTSDQLSTSANAYWRVANNYSVTSSYESLRGAAIGGEYFTNDTNTSTRLAADIDTKGKIRTSANQRWNDLQASYQGNESALNAQLTYRLSNRDQSDSGHEFVLGYQNSRQTTNAANSTLTSGLWRYRSPERVGDGRSLWQTELGYGFSGVGSGILANADLNFIPGLQLRGSYRGVSDNSTQANYAIELTTTLLTSGGIRGTFDKVEDFRTVGKVVFQPFLDKNQNGRQDAGEESYWDPLMIRINERPIAQYRPSVNNNQGDLNLPSGSYRLDIDPAGYPINYRSRTDALRVEVVSSGVTTVAVPLVPAYVSIGVVKDAKGDAVAGARVEATHLRTKTKVFSITNDAGFYTLEGLEQGEYQINVSGLPSTPNQLKITASSQPSQELNLTVTIPAENTPPPASTPPAASPSAPTSLPASPVSKPTTPASTPTSSRLVLPLIYMSNNF